MDYSDHPMADSSPPENVGPMATNLATSPNDDDSPCQSMASAITTTTPSLPPIDESKNASVDDGTAIPQVNELVPDKSANRSDDGKPAESEGLVLAGMDSMIVLLNGDLSSPYEFKCEGDSWEYILTTEQIGLIDNDINEMIRLVEVVGFIETNPEQGAAGHDIIEVSVYVGMRSLLVETFRVSTDVIRIDYAMRVQFVSEENSVCERISIYLKRYGPTNSYCKGFLQNVCIKSYAIPDENDQFIFPIQHCEVKITERQQKATDNHNLKCDNSQYDWIKGDIVPTAEPTTANNAEQDSINSSIAVEPFTTTILTGIIMRFLTLSDFCRLTETCRWVRYMLSQPETWAYASGSAHPLRSQNVADPKCTLPVINDVSRWIVLWWKTALSFSNQWPLVPHRRRFAFDARQLNNSFKFQAPIVSAEDDRFYIPRANICVVADNTVGRTPAEPAKDCWDSTRLPLWGKYEETMAIDPDQTLGVIGWEGLPLPKKMRKYFIVRVVIGVSYLKESFLYITTNKRPQFAPISCCGSMDGKAMARSFRLCDEPGNIEIKFKSRVQYSNNDPDIFHCPYIEFLWNH